MSCSISKLYEMDNKVYKFKDTCDECGVYMK